MLPKTEFIRGLKSNLEVARKLGMPTNIRAEDGTRESYQLAFGKMDADESKTIDVFFHIVNTEF